MNTNSPVVSQNAAADLTGQEHKVVKLTSTGIALATSAGPTLIVGTLMRGNSPLREGLSFVANTHPCDIALRNATPLHFAQLGFTSAAIAMGDLLALDPVNPGMLIPVGVTTATGVARAWDTVATAISGGILTIQFL